MVMSWKVIVLHYLPFLHQAPFFLTQMMNCSWKMIHEERFLFGYMLIRRLHRCLSVTNVRRVIY